MSFAPWIATAALTLAGGMPAPGPDLTASLLLPGTYHQDEVTAESGELWWAVTRGPYALSLEQVKLDVQRIWDPVIDPDSGMTGKQVQAQASGEVLFLFQGLPVAPGAVPAVLDSPTELPLRQPLELSLATADGERRYRWRVERQTAAATAPAADPAGPCRLLLETETETQEITTFWCQEGDDGLIVSDGFPMLLWAGDLDRDGRLDFLIDLTDHYNVSQPTLFVSSQAYGGELAAKVAEMWTVGC